MGLLERLGLRGSPPNDPVDDGRAPDLDPDDPAAVAPHRPRPRPSGGYGGGARFGSAGWSKDSGYQGGWGSDSDSPGIAGSGTGST